jgi:hypothetical protein
VYVYVCRRLNLSRIRGRDNSRNNHLGTTASTLTVSTCRTKNLQDQEVLYWFYLVWKRVCIGWRLDYDVADVLLLCLALAADTEFSTRSNASSLTSLSR